MVFLIQLLLKYLEYIFLGKLVLNLQWNVVVTRSYWERGHSHSLHVSEQEEGLAAMATPEEMPLPWGTYVPAILLGPNCHVLSSKHTNLKISQPQLLLTLGAKRVGSPLWGCPVHYGMFSGILGLQLWIPVPLSHPIAQSKCLQTLSNAPWGKTTPSPPSSHWSPLI